MQAREQFSQALHGPDVLLVTQRPKKPLPQRLFPAALPRARLQLAGLALETDARGLMQQFGGLFGCQLGQRSGARALQGGGPVLGRAGPGPLLDLGQRRVNKLFQGQGGHGMRSGPGAIPNHMQNHAGKRRIALVPVRLPVARNPVNFHVARTRRFLAELQDGPVEIGAGGAVPKAGMEHAQRLAVEGLQLPAPQPLMQPDALQEPFRGMGGIALPQEKARLILRPPAGIEIGVGPGHDHAFSGRRPPKSRPEFAIPGISLDIQPQLTAEYGHADEKAPGNFLAFIRHAATDFLRRGIGPSQ